ncbi:MAG: UDP-N-acetylmuramoyl-L-alanine--D-glutamate ligase [Flavobacteriaceae bacterium]|nr:UDP-N-acetylmuramoyl-L-alanine--D-glutamate ligase [Flavobacteriaceae bacterium]
MSKKIVVLGAGISGLGAAILAKKIGDEVFLSDAKPIAEATKQQLLQHQIYFEEEKHTEAKILQADTLVKSPGIPDSAPIVQSALKNGIEVISEIEFAARFTDAKIIAITGSNGKTTTTALTGHILKYAGLDAVVAGNIGESFALAVARYNPDYFVLEVSSFQLDNCYDFKPYISVLLNITEDHLDRYKSLQNYAASKARIFQNQSASDLLIYNADDPCIKEVLPKQESFQRIPFSTDKNCEIFKKKHKAFACLDKENQLQITLNTNTFTMNTQDLLIKGTHNAANAMAAATIANVLKIRKETIRESMAAFQGVPHRLEHVLTINKVAYINDSKATNVNAAYYALGSIPGDIVWIVGGTDKGNDYSMLYPLVRSKVKAIICLGADNQKLIDSFSNSADLLVETFGMEEAVKVAYKIAAPGETVLLSPACASFDLFKNYEERGEMFKEAVRKL